MPGSLPPRNSKGQFVKKGRKGKKKGTKKGTKKGHRKSK